MTRLDEFDRDEWFDIMRRARPNIARAEFDVMWDRFQRDKAAHQKRMQAQ